MLGLTDASAQTPAITSVQLLQAMLKFKRTSCLAHPLCVEFLNCKWRKFGAAIVIANILVYLHFLILLMALVISFPTYSTDPLLHEDSLARLVEVVKIAKDDNRTYLNNNEKLQYCYGHSQLRIALIVAVTLCLLKEILPMWYRGWQYFKHFSNITELTVYVLTFVFLDPTAVLLHDIDIPLDTCPRSLWQVAAMITFLGWIVLLLNFQRLPYMGIYIGMLISMVTTTIQFVIVASLFVLGFGLAFFMLLNNEPTFGSGGLSLMKTVLMTVGDLNYEAILPTIFVSDRGNISYYHHQLNTTYRQFPFVLRLPNISDVVTESSNDGTVDLNTDVLFSSLAYVMFVIFCLLMPIVVLNTLIGLAVGDIETSRKNAAFKQIHIQMELLVQLETALPPWFLSLIQVTYSQQSSAEGIKHWIHRATMAADVPDQEGKSPSALQLVEINNNIHMLNEWLTNLEFNMQQHLSLLKTLAECVKRQQTLTRPIVSKLQSVSDKGDVESETDLVEEPSAPLSDEEDAV